jgi:hypothetical protein
VKPRSPLTFNWVNLGESGYDRLQVWAVPTSFTPLNGTTGITATGTAPTGRVVLGLGATGYVGQSTWQTANITVPAAYAGTTFRLVFQWRNDTSGGSNPPIAVDNVSLISTCSGPTSTAATSITNNSAVANWATIAGATGYNVEYRLVGAGSWTASTGNPFAGTTGTIASTLSASSNYEYRVTGTGGGCASPGNIITFTTLCNPVSLPWSDGWESVVTVGTTNYPSCWAEVGSGGFASSASQAPIVPRTGTRFALCQWSQTNSFMWSPPFSLTSGVTYEFSSYYVTDGLSGWTDIGAFVNTSQVAAGATQLGALVSGATNTSYTQLSRQFTPGASGTYYFAVRVNANGTPNYMGFDDFSVQVSCSGAPTIGTGASATPVSSPICNSGAVNLNLGSGFTTGGGISYQWKQSTTGVAGTFTDISGATTTTYTTAAITDTMWFKGFVTCSNSGLVDSTAALQVNVIVLAPPTITSDVTYFCGTGGTAHLKASASPDPGYTWTWLQLEGIAGSSVVAPDSVDFTVSGSVGAISTIQVTGSFGGCNNAVQNSIGIYGSGTPVITATPNDSLCAPGGAVGLNSGLSAGAFGVSSTTYAPVTFTSPVTLVTSGTATPALTSGTLDDGGWSGIPLGFTFDFLGTNYSTVNVGTNGVMQFGAYNGVALGDYTIGALPNGVDPLSAIFMSANDLYLTGAGTNPGSIRYQTFGYAPNRRFVLEYKNVPTCCGVANPQQTLQVICYETTGIVEIHVEKALGANSKTIGVQNSTGTVGSAAPGRNGFTGTISVPEAWRFAPPANYTMTWTPAPDISGSNTGLNLFAVTTNTISTTTTMGVTALNLTNGCSTSDSFDITILATPSNPSGLTGYGANLGAGSATASPHAFCSSQILTATAPAGGASERVRWFNAATGGTPLQTGTNGASDTYTRLTASSANDTLWVEYYNGICSSAARTAMAFTFSAAPSVTIASLGPDLDANCGVGPTYAMDYQASSTNDPNYAYTWTFDGLATTDVDNGSGSASITSTVTTASTVTAVDAVTGCQTSVAKSFGVYAFPAVTPTATDTVICVGDSTQVQSGVTQGNFTVVCIPDNYRAPVSPTVLATAGGAVVPLSGGSLDDGGWGGIPLGFTFDYFGNNFTTVAAGTNGVAQFGTVLGYGTGNGNLGDFTFGAWPDVNNPANAIAVIANDLYLPGSGTVQYWTEGVAPNRVFVLEYLNVEGFWADGNHHVQMHVFETLGTVEIHAFEATSVDAKSIALQNDDATIGAAAPRCNVPGQFWNSNTASITLAFPWAWRFSPPVNYTFAWSPSGEISGSTTGANIMAVPTSAVPTTQTYSLTITDNTSGCVNAVPFTRDIEVIAAPVAASVDGIGSFSATPGTNTINICGDQTVDLNVTNGVGAWTAHYYDDALLTNEVFLANPYSATYTTGTLSATDSLWVTLDNGSCEGPAQFVEIVMVPADAISISNSSPVNCGPGSYSASLVASSTAPYSYTWNASPILSTLVGPSTTASPVTQTTVFVVNGDDGFCYTSANTAVSVYDFPSVTPTLSVDSICPGGSAVIYSNVDSLTFTVASQGYSPQSQVSPTFLVNAGTEIVPQDVNDFGVIDDGGWFNIPIGFTYNFFGNNYTTCHISTNGNLQFGNTANFSTDFSPGGIPDVTVPNNYVGATWADLNLEEPGSSLRYWTTGTAPNRVFCVLWDCEFFPGANGTVATMQAELYETTGNVEVHLQAVTNPSLFQVRLVGVEDLTGTIGAAAPGRNGIWETSGPEGWLFTPPADYSFDWDMDADILGSDILDTVVAQPVALSGTVTYVLNVTDVQTTCTNAYNIPLLISTAPPVANFGASPLTGTSGGVVTTHTMNNTSTDISGVTYAWSWVPATVAYVNGTTASSKNPQVQFTAPGNYTPTLVVTTCNGSDTHTIANYISITPEYCFPTWATGCADDMIDGVVIEDPNAVVIMSHTGTGCNGTLTSWEEYAPVNGVTSCTFQQGSTYQVTVNSDILFNEYFGLWMDVNNDGDFGDAGEFMGSNAVAAITATFPIGIASENVIFGAHRMRVIADFSGQLTAGDYCLNGNWGEGHDYTVFVIPPVISNDIPTNGTVIAYSSNQNYPNCTNINGNTALASNSPESTTYTGNDLWYRFVAQSTAASITLTSAGFDDVIELYTKVGSNYIPVAGGTENASGGATDFERLNIGGLTPGTTYYVSVGSVNNSGSGAFTVCISHLMRSWCAYTIPVGGFGLCDAYKAIFRGNPGQGVTYNFNFTGTGGSAPLVTTSITGTNGLTTLSQAVLALRYGGIYNASVDVVYTLNNSAGTPEPITVVGQVTAPNCTGVTIRPEPQIEVKLSQRCAATLLRSNYLIGTPVPGDPNACTATSYTYRITSVATCGDLTGLGTEYNTVSNTPYLQLGNLPLLGLNVGIWRVEIRPNFSYGNGTYGPSQWIQVNGTAVSPMLPGEEMIDNAEKSLVVSVDANLYPNPNNGEMVNLNVSGVESDNVFVRIVDAMGRVVYTNRFTVDGSLNTIVTFAQPLAGGLYNVEFTVDGQVMTERMIVTK